MAMKTAKSRKSFHLRNVPRWFRLQYLQLIRAKGGPGMVAMGFSIGLAVEMFTLPTGGVAFLLIFPLVYMLRASMAAAMIGFVIGKLIYIPMSFLMRQIGVAVLPKGLQHMLYHSLPGWLDHFAKLYLELFAGGVIVGPLLGLLMFFPIRQLLLWVSKRREEKRRLRRAAVHLVPGSNG
jgi:uncharacterized protein